MTSENRVTRRSVNAAFVAVAALGVVGPRPARATAAEATPLVLPRSTGAHEIGTVCLHLVDPARVDPWLPGHLVRELMIQLWYPAAHTAGHRAARYVSPLAANYLAAAATQRLGVPVPAATFADLYTAARLAAPVDRPARRGWPVVIFSPGDGLDRSSCTVLLQELASHGYVVAAIDHTHDSGEVAFPGGRVETRTIPAGNGDPETLVRAADIRFVIDQIVRVNAGSNPDAEGRPLPRGLAGSLDLTRLGMFGHSHGGSTTAEVMLTDPRVHAGADLDGAVSDRVATAGLSRPLLNLDSQIGGAARAKFEHNLAVLWPRLSGWHRWLRLRDSGHLDFTDFGLFAMQLHAPPATTAGVIGTIEPMQALRTTAAYLLAFFTQELNYRHQTLLDRPSPRYPEMLFQA